MEMQGEKSNKIAQTHSKGCLESSKPAHNQRLKNGKLELINSPTLFFKRNKKRLSVKLKAALVKREQIQKTRQEKLKKFSINYIPMCSDEDWEALAAFYAEDSKK
jgi:hypothetical protein